MQTWAPTGSFCFKKPEWSQSLNFLTDSTAAAGGLRITLSDMLIQNQTGMYQMDINTGDMYKQRLLA